ncbi:hypothetical protein [Nocardia terpenica]|uniref:Uncharacterized protein n=1 Tax=Nocardia terpenica TaxID=455432 RepID=A0A164JKK0_9NOCA|nr:hypothetical protein [Nocardia terpenica]KZM70491.1 hypothetical protein AWN90_38525 [Nocardia terpenica]NQE90276.1 hypothetical protein [Nocardia terpenica]
MILHTNDLHQRGTGILDPERGPSPERTAFVRRVPASEPVRDPFVYVNHIVESLERFVDVWTTALDSSLNCDWGMLEDEFPKIAILMEEVEKAHQAWTSLHSY